MSECKKTVRLSDKERRRWEKAAKKANRTLSDFIRDCVRPYVLNGAVPAASE